jgi:Ca2+-transporting ATPase
MLKAALIGNLCNNAFKNEAGVNVGQATEVALLNVLPVLEREDERKASAASEATGLGGDG